MKMKKELKNELLISLKNRNFDKVKDLVKNGAKPIGSILQTVSYENRLDLFEYFLFSDELPQNIDVKVKYDKIWGEASTFRYACLVGAIDIVKFIVEDSRVCNEFDFEKYTFNITYCLLTKSPHDTKLPIKPVIDFVLTHKKLNYIDKIKEKNFKMIKDILD
jgi:hypothetical protein